MPIRLTPVKCVSKPVLVISSALLLFDLLPLMPLASTFTLGVRSATILVVDGIEANIPEHSLSAMSVLKLTCPSVVITGKDWGSEVVQVAPTYPCHQSLIVSVWVRSRCFTFVNRIAYGV